MEDRDGDPVREDPAAAETSPAMDNGDPAAGLEGRGNAIASKSTEEATSSLQASDSSARAFGFTRIEEPLAVEGRRCELCGRGSEPIEELNTTAIVAGGDSTVGRGGLGRLLGPICDKMGVAAVWIHQECAVWSPEVYFLGVGCLKNVKAALRRGRFLKCSRCKQPGATIGCRVARCPRTYHLPCARQSGCSFNHKRYLMSCAEHVKLFLLQDKKRLRECMIDDQLSRKSFKETKVAENAEDDEFLKREKKRLHRDLARLAPVVLGGDSSTAQGDAFRYEGWESIGGLRNVVQCLKEMVTLPLLYPDIFHKVGIVPPRGVLLHGYPGTGKTLVVRALLGACARGQQKISYFSRKGADCLGKYVGDSERQLRLLFQLAEQSQPSIIFFDEIDGLAPKRTRNQDQTHSSVVSTLLALMDGLSPRGSVVVIGATNRPDSLDPALRRAGRFDREIFFPLPSVADREAILRVHTKTWKHGPSREVLSLMARSTVGFAGADLQALCAQAAMVALKRTVCLQDLLSVPSRESTELSDLHIQAEDWFAALAQAGPPCSRRLLGSALSEIQISPLPRYLVPVLLRPVLRVLSHLESDGRFSLPFQLRKPLAFVKEKKLVDTATSWSPAILKEVEIACKGAGIVAGDDFEDVDGNIAVETILMKKLGNAWKTDSLRILLTGTPGDGKSLVAASILHVFQSCMQVFLLSLQTMIQAGSGEVSEGLIQILSEARAVPSVVFMPRVESWALEQEWEIGNEEEKSLVSSRAWGTFLQQTRSLPSDRPVFFLATCDDQQLTSDVLSFFSAPTSSSMSTLTHRACVEVQVPTESEIMEVLDRAADSLALDLSTATKQTSVTEIETVDPPETTKEASIAASQSGPIAPPPEPAKQRCPTLDAVRLCGHQLLNSPHFMAIRQATLRLNAGPSLYLENPYSGLWVMKTVENEEATRGDTEEVAHAIINTDEKVDEKVDNSSNANENALESARRRALEPDTEENGPDDASRTVRGLDAVALKACKGFYTSGLDMNLELKCVMELLREKLNRKSSRRSQWFRYQLLAQAGALQDLMECWVHELRRLESRDRKPRLTQASSDGTVQEGQESSADRKLGSSSKSVANRRKMGNLSHQSLESLKATATKLFVDVWDKQGRSLMVDKVHDLVSETSAMICGELRKMTDVFLP
ncbi:ATPase family AAA domain-containing protein 2 [Selaginella moellendorffii]|uniref:ATPase family AAA domain-containing protein 2 n=1 Tax=Selaginella moellendorffii TaxID=88036 RepID=UPI000D1C8B2F|nr:ATPase family AAA domain-containing protein 2 [Selaginella moellendorffii]|eukprot:XP_024542136.1 ATPase family AAA domain-containing protein 2 [Selaginella moellendorffii]